MLDLKKKFFLKLKFSKGTEKITIAGMKFFVVLWPDDLGLVWKSRKVFFSLVDVGNQCSILIVFFPTRYL